MHLISCLYEAGGPDALQKGSHLLFSLSPDDYAVLERKWMICVGISIRMGGANVHICMDLMLAPQATTLTMTIVLVCVER